MSAKFRMRKRIEQHKKDVEYRRTSNSVIVRHVEEFNHEIDWDKAICLEKEKRLFARNILESAHKRRNKQRCMNLNEGIGVSTVYGKGKGAWLRRRKQEI